LARDGGISGIQLENKVTLVDEPKACDYTNLPPLREIEVNPLG